MQFRYKQFKILPMKKFFIFVCFLVSLCAQAKDDYIPMLTDGKVWNCRMFNPRYSTERNFDYQISVVGDTIVGKRQCKKIRFCYPDLGDSFTATGAFYEEDRKLYEIDGEEATLMLDFNLEKGYPIFPDACHYVSGVDYVTTGGIERRRIAISYSEDGITFDEPCAYWIEGMGTTDLYMWATDFPLIPDGSQECLLSCYDNGVCIYENDRVPGWAQTGVAGVSCERRMADGKSYDLSGRAVDASSYSGIMIHNGRKVVK